MKLKHLPKVPLTLMILCTLGAGAFTYFLKYDAPEKITEAGMDDGVIGALFYLSAISFMLATIYGYHYQQGKHAEAAAKHIEHVFGFELNGTAFGAIGCVFLGLLVIYALSLGAISVLEREPLLSHDILSEDPSSQQKGIYFGVFSALIVALVVFAYAKRESFNKLSEFVGFNRLESEKSLASSKKPSPSHVRAIDL